MKTRFKTLKNLSFQPFNLRNNKVLSRVIFIYLFLFFLPGRTSSDANITQDQKLIAESKPITFVGPRAGEGYFSADGKKMIFQSEREPGNPFYQIYLMDLSTGETEKISPGLGATTCSWIHPSGEKIMFSSTHEDPQAKKKASAEYAERKSGPKKYSWSFDDTYQIYEFDLKYKKYKKLTSSHGYNAEGNYSPDGKKIVFASNRVGYGAGVSDEDKAHFAKDPTWFMSIYIMDADGKNVRQLTDVRGYNGGPFFSPDGRRITFRRFSPDGQRAEVWTMNIDGTDQKQITKMGVMSWAPFYHPSGDYIIYASNKLGFSNFELYIVDTEGRHEPVRATYLDDFDGLPVFSPDGQHMAWTHRNEKGESQIWMGRWNDQKARELLGLPALQSQHLSESIDKKDLKYWIQFLSNEKMSGRATGSPEEQIYTKKISDFFETIHLSPVGPAKKFTDSFEFTSGVHLGSSDDLQIKMHSKNSKWAFNAKVGSDYIPASFSKNGETYFSEVVFAGYGLIAPASETQPVYDSYKDLDVKNKWVFVFRDIPENIANEKRIHLNMYSKLQHKALVARQAGAAGLIIASGPNAMMKQKTDQIKFDGRLDGALTDSGLPVLFISDDIAEKLIQSTGRSLKQWQNILDQGEIQNTPIQGLTIMSKVNLQTEKSHGENVIGEIRVSGAKETILIGAHGDHLGRGLLGSSLARGNEVGQIHFGADDNASGVAALLEVAHYLSEGYRNKTINLKRNIIFAVWSGEELGLLGSSSFIQKNKSHLVATLNMDMIGRFRDRLHIQGVGSAKEWYSIFEKLATKSDIPLSLMSDPYLPTDSMAFYMKSIPSISFFTGAHQEYHTPKDREELINYEGLEKITQFIEKTLVAVAGASRQPLTYQKIESSKKNLPGRSFRVFLGTIPDYVQEGIKGVKITGTSKDSPAEKAGLIGGDVIVEVATFKLENIYDYVYSLQSLKPGQPINIKILRGGKEKVLSITPGVKE